MAAPQRGPTRPGVENLGGWLTTVDRARVPGPVALPPRHDREDAGGAAPPASRRRAVDDDDPEHQALAGRLGWRRARSSCSTCSAPAERVAFVLHDVFAVPFDEVADDRRTLTRRRPASWPAARDAGCGVRRPRPTLDLVRQRAGRRRLPAVGTRRATSTRLVSLLDPDVVLRPDAAAVRMGALRETRGATAVATGAVGRGAGRAARDRRRRRRIRVGSRRADPGRGRSSRSHDGRIVAIDVTGDADRHPASSTSWCSTADAESPRRTMVAPSLVPSHLPPRDPS